MVATDPNAIDDRRKFKEALIRYVDMAAYLAVFLGGVGAFLSTPQTVKSALYGFPWLIAIWGSLLLIGGALGFVGRLTRIWVIEIPGASAGFFGSAMYFVILGLAALRLPTAIVAVALVACMMALLGRRYIELQILTSEPGHVRFREKVRQILQRRTADTVSKHH
ncbi:hypothetical protein [Leifsonia sp. 71-9]|uniref:hypothetical protein n=1 Tax=Leifsonia sp. 71-9 TaxID=1895934 RepID=UPI0009263EAB|nr:hypothetical protein [Leifsonia sp. 71-9]OJX72839.1 MAG: hypothetical protein BGO91_13805 [Leifsonia sp. 71-9]